MKANVGFQKQKRKCIGVPNYPTVYRYWSLWVPMPLFSPLVNGQGVGTMVGFFLVCYVTPGVALKYSLYCRYMHEDFNVYFHDQHLE